jgi:hypothetical protein
MKFILLVVAILSSQLAFAKPKPAENIQAKFPKVLICNAEIIGLENNELVIKALQSDQPTSNLYDAAPNFFSVDSDLTRIGFSNECDNYFSVVFFTDNLLRWQDDNNSIVGMVNYQQADMDAPVTVPITCSIH